MKSYPRPDPLRVEAGALRHVAPWLKTQGYDHPLLICDERTYSAAAQSLERDIREAGTDVDLCLLRGESVLANEDRVVEAMVSLKEESDVVIGVGGGTLTDIARFAAHRGRRPFTSVPTAASVDGFYSIGAPLILKGVKRTIICKPPGALFADTVVLSRAPRSLSAAGFGDLLGKLTSWADWNLGRLLWNEPFDQEISDRLLEIVEKTTRLAERIASPQEEDFSTLMRLLIDSGACMVDALESRPASGTEHHLSHYWEMSFLIAGKEPPLHGAKVGYATQIAAALYRHLLTLEPKDLNALLEDAGKRDLQSERKLIHEGYEERIALQLEQDQSAFLNLSGEDKKALFARVRERWPAVLDIARRIPEPHRVRDYLGQAGAPSTAAGLGISPDDVSKGLKYAHFLRNRFTVAKLYWLLGLDPEPVARSGMGGSW